MSDSFASPPCLMHALDDARALGWLGREELVAELLALGAALDGEPAAQAVIARHLACLGTDGLTAAPRPAPGEIAARLRGLLGKVQDPALRADLAALLAARG